jgi:hypothetical protein
MVLRCNATNSAGAPCSATPVRPSGWCWFHDPALTAERDAGRRKGGVERSNQSRARKQYADGALAPIEVQGLIGTTLRAVLVGKVTPGQGQAVAALARAAMTVREASEVEERLAELEARAGLSSERRTS